MLKFLFSLVFFWLTPGKPAGVSLDPEIMRVFVYFIANSQAVTQARSHGVMVSTLDSESSDPSSNLGGT